MTHGATPDDWGHFDLLLGLTADLLPVVSNPAAEISPDSKMKGKGKTPSIYNRRGQVAGIPKWTEINATAKQVEAWSKEPDYGICIQTRTVRALDIDVPNAELSARIAARWRELLGQRLLPCRYREGTGKQLLVFQLEGDFSKRTFKVEGGLVEFLAAGQQFIAVGRHPDGTRYAWDGGLPDSVPVISAEAFERAWQALVDEFAVEPERRASRRDGGGDGVAGPGGDDVAAFLDENWETYGYDRDGSKLFVLCPWKDGHSGDSGETEAAWLVAGTSGYQLGHFQCLHASCAGRKDSDFFAAVGYGAHDFDDISQDAAELYIAEGGAAPRRVAGHPVPDLPLPGFERDKSGAIEPTIGNAVIAVGAPEACGQQIMFDLFRGELMIQPAGADMAWRPFKDADAVALRVRLAQIRFKPVGKELMRDALVKVADDHQQDTAQLWLTSLPPWDGVDRVSRLYPDYFKTDDTEYTRAVGRYVMTAHAGRVMLPGCKADMVPVLVGEQGTRKSSGIAALSPSEEFFNELDLKADDDKLARLMRGLLVAELGELKGLNSRDAESIRQWIVKRHDKWVPKYQEYATTYPRRALLHGSHNIDEFLADDTGERRWLPMRQTGFVDVDGIVRDRDQLWAQGLAMWREGGVAFEEAERLARPEHASFKIIDPWMDRVTRWLDEEDIVGETPRTSGTVTTEVVALECLGLDHRTFKKADEMRVGKILQACGMVRAQRKVDGRNTRVWVQA